MHDGPPLKFLTGVFIATLALKQQVQFLQEVIQADDAHMSFGKYTLFSAYTSLFRQLGRLFQRPGSSTVPFIVSKTSRRSLEVGKGIHLSHAYGCTTSS
jgi:hypothetical protein